MYQFVHKLLLHGHKLCNQTWLLKVLIYITYYDSSCCLAATKQHNAKWVIYSDYNTLSF